MDQSGDIGPAPSQDGEPPPGEPPSPAAWLELEAVEQCGDWQGVGDLQALASRVALAIGADACLAAEFGIAAAGACVAFADDASVQGLNAQYRLQDKPTNVLSFPSGTAGGGGHGPQFLGDIILASETVSREASEKAVPVADHVQHLILHGVLHLLGFDHEFADDADEMEDTERRVLLSIGIADPYRDHE